MKTKLLLTVIVALGLALPVSARLISFSPTELDFGSVAVGDTGWQEVRFRYSGPDSGEATVRLSTSQGWEVVSPFGVRQSEALRANLTLDTCWVAAQRFQQEFGYYPASVDYLIELGRLELDDAILEQWHFSFIYQDPIRAVEGVSTAEMPFGAGYIVMLNTQTGERVGWGYGYGKFRIQHEDVYTMPVRFRPRINQAYVDTLDITVYLHNTVLVESYSIVATGNGQVSVVGIDAQIPSTITLDQPFPNPFNSTTSLSFSLPSPSDIRLTIVRPDGREVAVLKEGFSPAGNFIYSWNAGNAPAGAYYARLVFVNGQAVRQILLIR